MRPPPSRNAGSRSAARLLIGSIVGIVVYFGILLFFQYISNLGSPDPVAVANAFPSAVATSAQQVGNALVLGAIYALVALGYTMVYGIIELINFAHGDVFMVGTFIGLFFLTTFPAPLDFLGLHLPGHPDHGTARPRRGPRRDAGRLHDRHGRHQRDDRAARLPAPPAAPRGSPR